MRAFLAAPAGEATRLACAALIDDLKQRVATEASGRARITWVQPVALHLTLKFLGDIDDAAVPTLRDAVDRALRGATAGCLPLSRLGVFPRSDFPRALWIGPPDDWHATTDAKQLASLRDAIERSAVEIGLPAEPQPWRPHLTLARVRSGERQVGRALRAGGWLTSTLEIPMLTVDRVVLMKSELLADGAKHTPLWERLTTPQAS